MDSTDLRVFEAVARLGAMNRAATELNTVQSSVTSRIRQLEQATSQSRRGLDRQRPTPVTVDKARLVQAAE
jgi:DNA-binding transcriptional LysR family regulator